MYQYEADNNAVFDLPAWNVSWKAPLGDRVNGGFSIVGDSLYVESFDRNLYAFDAQTGVKRWELLLPNIAMNTPVVVDGIVYAGTGSSHILYDVGRLALIGSSGGDYVYAVDTQTGKPLWNFNTPGEAMPSGLALPAGQRTVFVFSTGDGHVRGLDAKMGALLWQSLIPGYATMGSLVAYGNLAIGTSEMTPLLT